MKENIKRTHDKSLYLEENRYNNPKEIFNTLASLAISSGALREGSVVCDFGCAAGEFLFHLHRCLPGAVYSGFDILPELVEKARQNVPAASFRIGSVLDQKILEPATVDLAFLLGVHTIFDEIEPCLSNLLCWTKPGGKIFLFSFFNDYPVDVWVKYRLVDGHEPEHREPGWNLFSKISFSRYLDKSIGPGRHRFIPFEMPYDLPPHQKDIIRTWTFRDQHDRRLFTNGLSMIYNMEILAIDP